MAEHNHFKVGDKGQRYEIIAHKQNGDKFTVGWSESLMGANNIYTAIKLHPTFHSPKIVDRKNIKKAKE